MNSYVRRYYRKFSEEDAPIRLFHDVICLHDSPELSWSDVSSKVQSLSKGWFELSRLSKGDRIEFTLDFWVKTLPFVPHVYSFLQSFFSKLDDVGIFLTQVTYDAPYACELVYSLRDGSCFFHGLPPCEENEIAYLRQRFDGILPESYLAFLSIHNGFSKHSDTGLLTSMGLEPTYFQLQSAVATEDIIVQSHGKIIDPKDLIPFYESFGQQSYQCFYTRWFPDREVGNVYYSRREHAISDIKDRSTWLENLAFPTFLDWLVFYLEGVES
jgi:hypothetical protein